MRLKLTFISKTFIKKKISPHGKFKVLLGALAVKKLPAYAGDISDAGLIPRLGRSSGVGNGNPFLPGESHEQRSLAGYSP